MRNTSSIDSSRPIPMSIILLTATAVHLPLMLMELPLKSYDTNFHIFFASHYLHHWFDPWNLKWYAGFSQTSYPPLPQQWTAVLSLIFGLNMAYMMVQFVAILLLAIGVYRFSEIWVSPRAASYAALAAVFLSTESGLVYNAGQLGTTAAAPLYLLALPYLYKYLRFGGWRSFLKAMGLFAAAAGAHHATLIFASFFFAIPVLLVALIDRQDEPGQHAPAILFRTAIMSVVIIAVAVVVLLPFWVWLFHNPAKQAPIPHQSRANYILSPEWGEMYFLMPWSSILWALPLIFIRGCMVKRLRPLMLFFWVCFLVGLGGTTPVGVWLLHRAFYVLTFERFAYWASLLALPIFGAIVADLVGRFRMKAAVPIALMAGFGCALAASWTTFVPSDDITFSVDSTAAWLNRGDHSKWRYITLGFGNKLSRLSMETKADSIDGESNESRNIPEMTEYGGAALSAARFFAPGGLESLRAVLAHADRYGLKWVIVYDPYYEPLLKLTGWRKVDQLDNGRIVIYGMHDVPPAHPMNVSQIPPRWQGIMWGTLPMGSSILAILFLAFLKDDAPPTNPETEAAAEAAEDTEPQPMAAGQQHLMASPPPPLQSPG
ncbi:MAG TPA: hypothetical protein VGS02_02205 [Acidobacteriaceae bacterium]|nr:hypothetical protein [Acidobacteriaceae bacterium]